MKRKSNDDAVKAVMSDPALRGLDQSGLRNLLERGAPTPTQPGRYPTLADWQQVADWLKQTGTSLESHLDADREIDPRPRAEVTDILMDVAELEQIAQGMTMIGRILRVALKRGDLRVRE